MKSLFILTIALILCFFALPVQGLAAIESLLTHDRPLLTLERLQSQLKAPIPSEGSNLIDLRKFTLDLRPQNAEFVDFSTLACIMPCGRRSLVVRLTFAVR